MSKEELFAAVKEGSLEKVTGILQVTPDLAKEKDENGNTPLHHAAYHGCIEIMGALLANGADKDVIGNNNWTPLYIACTNAKSDAALFLLNKGANPNIAAENGKTPLDKARDQQLNDLQEALIANGATGRESLDQARSASLKGRKEIKGPA